LRMLKVGDWILNLKEDSHPRELMIELTTVCNYSCPHCFRFSVPGFKAQHMDFSLFELILESMDRTRVEKATFSGWGEPTLHPSFLKIIKQVKSRGKRIVLNTNGSSLVDIAEDLVFLEVDEVVISLRSFEEDQGIRRLREEKIAKGANKPVVKVLFTVTKDNLAEIPKAADFVKELGVREVFFSHYIPYPGGLEDLPLIDDEDIVDIDTLLESFSPKILGAGARFAYPELSPNFARECPFAANRALFIRCDGVITPCLYLSRSWKTTIFKRSRDILEFPLGNMAEDDLMDLWRGSYSEMFFRLCFNHLPSCLECPFKEGCKFTQSSEMDCWGNSPNCAHCPYLHKLALCPL